MIRALVVEDSRLAREGLVRMLAAHPQIEVVGQAGDIEAALQLAREQRPELIFLDIHLPGGNAFELLEQLDELPRLIFTTAYADYAIRSFDYDTVDYLLKPISEQRLAQAITKLRQAAARSAEPVDGADVDADADVEAEAEAEVGQSLPALEIDSKIFLKDGERCHLIALRSVRYIESCKNYVQLVFGEGQAASQRAYLKKTMNAVEARLPRGHFFRASRTLIVNLHATAKIEPSAGDGYLLTMVDGQRLEISRRQAGELKALLSL